MDVKPPTYLELIPEFVLQKPTVIHEFATEAGLLHNEGRIETSHDPTAALHDAVVVLGLLPQYFGNLCPVSVGGEDKADRFVDGEGFWY